MITGGQGKDRLNGNRGNDTVTYQAAPAGVDVSLADRRAADDGHGTKDPKIKKIENLIGSDHDDTLQGNKKPNTIDGRRGTNDLIPGATGDIILQTGITNTDLSRAIWVWEAEAFQLLDDPTHRAQALDLLADNGINTLYLYADEFNSRTPIADEPNLYHDLLADIHARGMTAHALLGSAFLYTNAYILPENRTAATDMFQRVLDYNAAATPDQQFDGIHTNILPYTDLDLEFRYLALRHTQYLDLLSHFQTLNNDAGSVIPVGASIPFWFQVDQISFLVDQINHVDWNGIAKPLHQHAQDINDYVTVMAFRDHAGPAAPTPRVDEPSGFYQQVVDAFETTGRNITVELSDDANGAVAAGSLVIRRLDEYQQLYLNPSVVSGEWPETDLDLALTNSRGVGHDVAQWSLTDTGPGTYFIGATWPGGPEFATDAPFTIYDDGTPITTVRVNQQTPSGGNGITSLAWAELQYAQQINKPAYVAVETGDEFNFLTFKEEGPEGLEQELRAVADAFGANPNFAGFAINDLPAYTALLNGTTAPEPEPTPPSNNDQVCFAALGSSPTGQICVPA